MSPLSNYQILVMDYSMGRAFIISIQKPVEDDFEEHVDAKLAQMGFRIKDCSWMEFTDCDIEDLTNEI